MRLTKRMQNAIIQGTIANIIFCIILLLVAGFYIVPKIKGIQSGQQELIGLSNSLTQMQSTGISYRDFTTTVREKGLDSDPYFANIMRTVDQNFYEKTFTSTGGSDYMMFLQTLTQELLAKKSSDAYIQKDQLLNKVLPFYAETNKNVQDGLNDFFFTNYIEQLMYVFRLTAQGDIGVGTLQKVEAEKKPGIKTGGENEGVTTIVQSEDIYSLPLSFDVTGQKSDIVDFIHFFENVGSIKLEGENINIYNDVFISKILTENRKSDIGKYNLYENQIADIQKISFDTYPDSSRIASSYTPLVSLMKTVQGRETFTVQVDLNFYVVGAPIYKLQQYTKAVQVLVDTFLEKVQQDEQKIKKMVNFKSQSRSMLQSFRNTALSLKTELEILNKDIVTGSATQVYEKIVAYEKQIEQIQDLYSRKMSISLEK